MNEAEPRSRAGRKRDPGRDGVILDAALTVLAEHGYDGMTIDMVAARAGSARATVYRRWATKNELVLAAVERMSRDDVNLDQLPDTGSLRGDIVAMILPLSDEEQRVRIQAMTALLALSRTDSRLAEAATGVGIGPWIEVNRILIQRAVDRGEFPPPDDLDTLAELIPMMCVSRAVQQQPITREFSLALVDGVIIPALRGAETLSRTGRPREADDSIPGRRHPHPIRPTSRPSGWRARARKPPNEGRSA